MSGRQWVAVQFKPWDRQSYTYHNDGEPVAIGDRVVVNTNKGPQEVEVVGLPTEAPKFETKPIVGKPRRDYDDAERELIAQGRPELAKERWHLRTGQ